MNQKKLKQVFTEIFQKNLEKVIAKCPNKSDKISDKINSILENPNIGRSIGVRPSKNGWKRLKSYIDRPLIKMGWWSNLSVDDKEAKALDTLDIDFTYESEVLEMFGVEFYSFEPRRRVFGLQEILKVMKEAYVNNYVICAMNYNYKRELLELRVGKESDKLLLKVAGWDLENLADIPKD